MYQKVVSLLALASVQHRSCPPGKYALTTGTEWHQVCVSRCPSGKHLARGKTGCQVCSKNACETRCQCPAGKLWAPNPRFKGSILRSDSSLAGDSAGRRGRSADHLFEAQNLPLPSQFLEAELEFTCIDSFQCPCPAGKFVGPAGTKHMSTRVPLSQFTQTHTHKGIGSGT
jgi:hypothetical protein